MRHELLDRNVTTTVLILSVFVWPILFQSCFRSGLVPRENSLGCSSKITVNNFYLRWRRLCFHFGLFVCLSVCQITEKVVWVGMAQGPMSSILVTIRITLRIQESEVRNPHSLDYRKSYQRILTKFYGELGCGLETNWLHFGDNPDHRSDSGVHSRFRNPLSLDSWSYQRILMKFYGELGCGLETNWLHFGGNPGHHLDPGVRSGSRSGSWKNCQILLCWHSAEV